MSFNSGWIWNLPTRGRLDYGAQGRIFPVGPVTRHGSRQPGEQRIRKRSIATLIALTFSGAVLAQPEPAADPKAEEEQEIVVTGNVPKCRPLEDDPLDRKPPGSQSGRQMVLKAKKGGGFHLRPDDDPVLGPVTWQRAGTAIGDYVYANPTDGGRLCIGAKERRPDGFGQIRRVLDARPMRGKYVVFRAFAMASRAAEARFWLAAGDSQQIYRGGDTRLDPLSGSTDWIPVTLTIGPIPRRATKLSYGFLLHGRGDVWVDEPTLEVTDTPPLNPDAKALAPVM